MPIFYDRIADQIEDLLPEYYQKDGPRFISFIKAYFEFLEKGQLVYKNAADIDYIGLEDGTVAGEAFNTDGQRGIMLQELGTYSPSSITNAKINYEHDVDTQGAQKTSFEKDEYVVGTTSGAIGRIDVIGTSSNLYIEQFSEAQFDIDEEITGMTSGMTAEVSKFTASPLHAANNLLSYADVDKTSGDFLEYFRRDFMPLIDRDVLANKRLLQKHIQDLYLAKGTKESYEFLFRILYGLEAEIAFPTENVIRPSESEFVEPTVMRLYSTSDLGPFKGGTIKKLLGNTIISQASINDIYGMAGTNDALDAYEVELILPYVGSFSAADTVIISDRDGLRTDVTATVRGIMTDVDPTESSIYVGLEDKKAADIEDNIRLESYEVINIVTEGADPQTFVMEDSSNSILEYTIGSDIFEITFFELEDGTQTGAASSGKLLIDAISIADDGEALGGATYDSAGVLVEDNALVHEQPAGYPHIIDAPDTRTTTAGTFHMGGGIYQEQPSLGALYSESDTFNYKTPLGGTATQSINVIGSIGRGEITDVVIDDAGTSYSAGDPVIFVNSGTDGLHAEAEIAVTDSLVELERGTPKSFYPQEEQNVFTFTGDGSNKVFSGVSNEDLKLGFDPRNVEVFVGGTELTRETQFTSDQSGQKITIAAGTAAPGNGVLVEIHKEFQGILLEDALRPPEIVLNVITGLPERDPVTNEIITKEVKSYITNESAGAIRKIKITNPGVNYKSVPQVFIGGHIYYDTMTTGTAFAIGEVITSSNGITMIVVKHDTVKKKVTVYKRPSDPVGTPTGTITGGSSLSAASIFTTTAITQKVNGAVSNSKVVVLDSATNVHYGQLVTGTGISGSVTVSAVDESTNTIHLDSAQSISDDVFLSFANVMSDVTKGRLAKLWAWGDRIGSVKKLKMQDVGHDFDEGGIGNYRQNAIIKDVSSGLASNTTVTATLTGASGLIHSIDPDRNILVLKDVKGMFIDGDYCTTSDSKNFVIAKINPCTARGKLGGVALLDGNYTNDTGFPSVDSQRIHDGLVYQDFSYKIKVGKSINDYRSIVKSLLSPAGTIFFGEVAVRSLVDARAEIYNKDFDGTTTTRSFIPTLIIGSRMDTADITLEDGTVPNGVMELEQNGSTGSGGVAGVYTFEPNVDENIDAGLEITVQLTSSTAFQNLLIIKRGTGYDVGDNVHITRAMVGGSGNTVFASFTVKSVGSPLETSNNLTFTGGIGKVELETGEGVMTTERFLAVTSTTVRDQASGILYQSDAVPEEDQLETAQAYVVGEKFTPTTRDFFNRQLIAELSPKGHRVHKELDIEPSYNQHKIYYTTLSNALAVGTVVRGGTSYALGTVMQHDTTNKFIIVHRDSENWGKAGSQFSGTEIIQNTVPTHADGSTTNYFTATSIELHWTPEDVVTKQEPSAITADTYITSQAQKTATEGGADTFEMWTSSGINPGSTAGYHGRGKVLVATDQSETYDSEMKQRKFNIVSSPIFSQGVTQRGKTFSAGIKQARTPLNQKGARTEGTNTIVAGDTAPPYLAINGTSLRLDDIKNSVTSAPGDSSITIRKDTGSRTGVDLHGGENWGYRPAGQKLYETTNFISENIISEANEKFIMEEYPGRIEISSYPGDKGGILLNEDDTRILSERGRTHQDEAHYFVSEESTQIASYNLISESGERIIDESGNRFLYEEALMIGKKESNQSGPTIGDLRNIMFTENYGIMNKVYEENFYVLDETDSDNILMEDGTLVVSESDDIVLETGEHMLQESLSEGLKISDISTIYPDRLVSNLERELGRRTNLNHSAVVQTG